MKKLQKFVWIYPNNVMTTIEEWVNEKLTPEEQTEFYEAQKRNIQLREEAIAQGRMIETDEGYLWKNDEEYDKGKENEPVWQNYWYRWIKETGITLQIEKIDHE